MEKLLQERLDLQWIEVQQVAQDRNRWKQLLNELKPRPERTKGRK